MYLLSIFSKWSRGDSNPRVVLVIHSFLDDLCIVGEDQLSSTPFYNFFSTNFNVTSLSFLGQITVEMNNEHTVDHITVGDIPILSQR